MSSTFLDSTNINMIVRLLREVHEPGATCELKNQFARFLVRRFEQGTFDERRLRIALRRYVYHEKSTSSAIDNWSHEGGATAKGFLQ